MSNTMSKQPGANKNEIGKKKRPARRSSLQTRMTLSYVWTTGVLVLLLEILGVLLLIGAVVSFSVPKLVHNALTDVMAPAAARQAQFYSLEASLLSNGPGLDSRLTFTSGQPLTLAPPHGNSPLFPDSDKNSAPGSDGPGLIQSLAVDGTHRAVILLIAPNHRVVASSDPTRYPVDISVTALSGLLPEREQLVAESLSGVSDNQAHMVGSGGIVAAAEPVWNRMRKPIGVIYVEAQIPPLFETQASGLFLPLVIPIAVGGLLLLLLLTPIGGVFGLLITRGHVQRVRHLVTATIHFAAGDYTQRVRVSARDELGQLEQQFNHMAEQLIESMTRGRELAEQNARMTERDRLSRELHDAISQNLFSLHLLAGGLLVALPANSAVYPQLLTIKHTITTTIREMRALLLELRPAQLEHLGLTRALEDLAAAYRSRLGITITTAIASIPLPSQVEHALLRITQEALSNAARHADANAIELSLQQCGQDVQLIIEDNGCGFSPEIPQIQHGLGLRSMRERVAELHGTFMLQTLPGQGTHIQITLPLEVRS
jgi:signal transduction histidine kinase